MLEKTVSVDMNSVPHTAIAWDLVRIVNLDLGFPVYLVVTVVEDMWNNQCVADETASQISLLEEYGS